MRFFTFRKNADAAKQPGQKVRFKHGFGYFLFGKAKVAIKTRKPFTMYDSVTVSEIPSNAVAVAGYTSGWYPTFPKLQASFPHAKKLSVAVSASHDAVCLDVETGDATNSQAASWIRRQQSRGVKRPVIYTSVSNASSLLVEMARVGIRREDIRLWTAHYTYHEHLCSSACGFGFRGTADATQWSDKALGRNLDASFCSPRFL